MNGEVIKNALSNWLSPAGVLVLFGGIVWGIQLNIAVVENAKAISKLTKAVEVEEAINVAQNETLARTAVILDNITERLRAAEGHVVEHDRDAEQWKRRIIRNESILERMRNGKE